MNNLEVCMKISQYGEEEAPKVYEATIRSNYTPGDTDSIFNCIRDLNDQTKRIKEDVDHLNKLYENGSITGFNSSATVISGRIKFARPDGTTIDELEIDDLEEIEFTTRFINTFNLV